MLRRTVFVIALGLATTVVTSFMLGATVKLKGGATKVARNLDPVYDRVGKIVLFHRQRRGAALYQATTFPTTVTAHDDPFAGDPVAATPRWARDRLMPWLRGLRPWPESMETFGIVAAGWPMPALYAWFENHRYPQSGRFDMRGGISVARSSERFDTRVIPFTPIWSGLAINTAIYSAIWTTVLFVPRFVRRSRRRRSGRCPACGYELNSAFKAGCPECGWNR